MRIGLVCPYSLATPGGVQNHVLGLAGWLKAQGHTPVILAPGDISAAALARRGLAPREVTSLGRTIGVRWNGSVARVAGGPLTAWRVHRWLTRHQLDVLHIHEPVTPSAGLWALLWSNCPTVVTFHLATRRSRLLHLAGRVLQPWLRRIDRSLAVSPVAATVVREHLGLEPDIVANGIDIHEFVGPRSQGRSAPRLMFLGRLSDPRKGLAVLLAAVPDLRATIADVEVIVAGPGEMALPVGVVGLGDIDDDQRAAQLRSSDIFIAPHTHGESFGLVLVEAMAAGTAVVAAELPAFVDVLTDTQGHRLGHTFATGDPRDLVRAVVATLTQPRATPAQLRRRAAHFDWNEVGPEIVTVYADAMGLRWGSRQRNHPPKLGE